MPCHPPKILGLLNNAALAPPSVGRRRRRSSAFHCGAGVATMGAVQALIEFGTFDRYELFALPHRVCAVSNSLEPLRRRAASKSIAVNDYRRLLQDGTRRFDVWYDAYASNIPTAAYVRETCSDRPYPITGTIHTISYQSQLHETLLPMLLANAYPFDSIICTSQAARAAFAARLDQVSEHMCRSRGLTLRWPGRLDVIPLGVDTETFRPRDKAPLRRTLGLPVSACILLCVSRLSAVDKMDLVPLLTVVKRLIGKPRASSASSVLLVIAGSDYRGEGAALKQAIGALGLHDHVRVIASPEETAPLYAAADVFVSPADNIQESFGLTNLEAMASGVPQVVSDWNGYRDTVRHGETGFRAATYWTDCDRDLTVLAPLAERTLEFDHASLAQSVAIDLDQYHDYLDALVTNEDLRREMGQRARDLAVREYGWPAITRRYEALWEELTRESSLATPVRRAAPGLIAARQIDAFGHYATTMLNGASRCRLTRAGRACRRRTAIAPAYSAAARLNLLQERILRDVLAGLDRTGHTVTLGELSAGIATDHQEPVDYVRRHVMWLMKYGLIECVSNDSPS